MSKPSVSVIIPAYNAKSTVLDAIASALNQSYPPLEIIVVNDGSTDGTADAVRRAFGDRIRLITQENRGVAEARNRGVEESTGDYLQFLDADDMLSSEKLMRSLEACMATDAAVLYSQARFVEADGITTHPITFPDLPSGQILLEWLTGTMANGSFGVASSMFVRRDALLAAGKFEKACTPCEDWDMWIRLAAKYNFVGLNAPLVVYRVMPGGLSKQMLRMANGRLVVIQRARELPEVKAQLSRAKLDALEAGRWHVYAMRLWEDGNPSAARKAFASANALSPSMLRRIYSLMSYVFPAASTTMLVHVLHIMRGDRASNLYRMMV